MEPASLPLELFIEILQHLDVISLWRLRRISRSWDRALSSDLAVKTVLKDRDPKIFQGHYTGKPTSCTDFSSKLEVEVQDIACGNTHLILRTTGDTHREGLSTLLLMQEIGGDFQRLKIKRRGLHGGKIVLGNVVAFLTELDLVIATFQGESRIIPIPDLPNNQMVFRTDAVSIHKDKIAFVYNQTPPPVYHYMATDYANLWTYDISSDIWSSDHIPELQTGFTLPFVQGILIDEIDMIVVTVTAFHQPSCLCNEPFEHTVQFWSSSGSHWQQSYVIKVDCTNLTSPRGCNISRLGSRFRVHVARGTDMHYLTLTHEGLISADALPIVHSDGIGSSYRILPLGVETRAGYLWNNSHLQWNSPLHIIVNDGVLLWMRKYVGGTQLLVLRFGSEGSLEPLLTWEERRSGKDSQVKMREQAMARFRLNHGHGSVFTPPVDAPPSGFLSSVMTRLFGRRRSVGDDTTRSLS